MSTSQGAIARRHPRGDRRIAALAALPLTLVVLAAGTAYAELPPGVTRLSAADAERAGSTIRLLRQAVGDATLVRIEPPAAGMSLLAISADGAAVALADRLGEPSGVLTLAEIDGAQLRVPLPGLLAAAFAADGSWLAVIDGRGALWRVDATSGRGELLADGPFIGSPLIAADGSLALLAVSSVEAPFRSQLVRFEPATGSATLLSDAELVYGTFPLDDGDLAMVAHDPGGTTVHRLSDAGERLLADLGAGSVNVAVARNGRIAFERNGEGIYLLDAPGSAPRGFGMGTKPCFATDGSSLMIRRGDRAMVLAVDGSLLAVADELAGFAGSAGCLR